MNATKTASNVHASFAAYAKRLAAFPDAIPVMAYLEAFNGDGGQTPVTIDGVESFLGVWESCKADYVNDHKDWVSAGSPTSSDGLTTDWTPAPAPAPGPDSAKDGLKEHNDTVVNNIVGMIRAKYTEEGERNFDIGRCTLEHAQWQRNNFTGTYTSGDFDSLVTKLRADVRLYVPIKAESIQIAHWVRCHVLRELVAGVIGEESAKRITFHEYKALIGKALKFDVPSLTGEIVSGWVDMIRSLASDRERGIVVKTDDFNNRIVATENAIKAAKLAALNPTEAATKAAQEKVKADAQRTARLNKTMVDAMNEGISTGAVSAESALGILESVAKAHNKPLKAASIGVDPSTITTAECQAFIGAMFAAGKLEELKALVSHGQKAIRAAETAMASAKPAVKVA